MVMLRCVFIFAALLVGACASTSAEWEFRQFAELTKSDLERVKATVTKPKGSLKLSGGRNAVCERGLCVVSWSKPKLTLFRRGHEGKAAQNGKGTFTLDLVETTEMLNTISTATAQNAEQGRVNNLGFDCSPASCRLNLYFYTEKDDSETEDQILQSLLGGKFFKEGI